MKLMFKGYQGVFSDKSFCKLRRRRKCENEQSAVTLPCLPVSFQHITCAQVGNKYELTSALIGQKSDLKLPPNSGEDVSVFYFQLGNNFARILEVLHIGKQCKPVQVHLFTKIPPEEKFSQIACWGKHPQSPLNATCGVSCAFILNTFTY